MIPFYKPPKLDNASLRSLRNEIARILDSGMLTNGEYCRKLEEKVVKLHGCYGAITCSSATAGLKLMMHILGTKVIGLPAFTWDSVYHITETYKRGWLDIDPATWLPIPTIHPYRMEQLDTILLQHTFGNLCVEHLFPLESLIANKINIIYDAAYNLGVDFWIPNEACAVLSMSPTKTITACEGGIILLKDEKLAEKVTAVRDKCSRLSEVHAAVALEYLTMLKWILQRKKEIFEYYHKKLPVVEQLIPIKSSYGYYGMLVPGRRRFRDSQGWHIGEVECRVRYLSNITMHACTMKELIGTSHVTSQILCLPCYPDLNEKVVVEEVLTYL